MKAIPLITTLLLSTGFAYSALAQEEISAAITVSDLNVESVHETDNQILHQDFNNALSVSLDEVELQSQPGLSRRNLYQVSEEINSQRERNRQKWEIEVDWENNKLKRYF